jgi:hypothetical protein
MTIAKFINTLLLWLTVLAFTAQCWIDFSTENIAANCMILASVFATLLYFRWSKALDTHPLSSFAIFGFCVTSQLGALLAQSAAWTAVSSSLHQPLVTFAMLSMYLIIALLAHTLYRMMTPPSGKQGLLRHTLQRVGVYTVPSVLNLWVMGGMGIFFLLLSKVNPVANGLSFIAWAPFLIPIYAQQLGSTYCNLKKNSLALLGYAIVIGITAVAFNARGTLLSGWMIVSLLFLLVGMRSTKLVTASMLLKLGMLGLLAAALSWPASNLVTAMAIVRNDRHKVSASELVKKTLGNLQDVGKIEAYRTQALAHDLRTAYDEKYLDNPLLARLVITKFHDNAIYFAGKISDRGSEELLKVSGDFFWTTLPQPFLDVLKIDVDKEKMRFSMGDMLAHLAVGTPLGGYRTGSIFGQGWALFGYFFPVIYFAMCLILFAAVDLFAIQTVSGKVTLAVIGMLNVWPNFLFGITADSLQQLFISVVRGVPQLILLYVIIFYLAKTLSKLVLSMLRAKNGTLAAQ